MRIACGDDCFVCLNPYACGTLMAEPIDMLPRDERAAEAQELLDNPLLQEVFKRLADEAIEQLQGAKPASEAALSAHYRLLAIRSVQADLVRLVNDPKMLRAADARRRRLSS
jgi:hypothetical protein